MIRKMFNVDNEVTNELVRSMCIDGLLNELVFLTVAIGDKSTSMTDVTEMECMKLAVINEIKRRNTEPS